MRFRFIKMLLFMIVGMTFIKVYQHNLFVKAIYGLQRVRHKKYQLKKDKAQLLLEYSQHKNIEKIYDWAVNERGMHPCSLDSIVTLTLSDSKGDLVVNGT